MFIVTNYGGGKNYTPSVFKTEDKAKSWFKELVAGNILDAYEDELESIIYDDNGDERTDSCEKQWDDIIEYAKTYIDDVEVSDDNTEAYIGEDPNEGGNVIQLFELNDIN